MGTARARSVGREHAEERGRVALPRSWRLPSGRAMVGALMVVAAASGVWLLGSHTDDDPPGRYLVTTRTVPAGAIVTEADLGQAPMELGPVADSAVEEPAAAIGRRALRQLVAGELLHQSALSGDAVTDTDATGRELSLALPVAQALGGQLRAGQSVVVVGSDDLAGSTDVIAPDAVVVAVAGDEAAGIGAGAEVAVTLAVGDEPTALAVIEAHERGSVTLVARSALSVGSGGR